MSKSLRKVLYHMQRKHEAKYIHFHCDANSVEGEDLFDWRTDCRDNLTDYISQVV